jgi:hypothetical protein
MLEKMNRLTSFGAFAALSVDQSVAPTLIPSSSSFASLFFAFLSSTTFCAFPRFFHSQGRAQAILHMSFLQDPTLESSTIGQFSTFSLYFF